MHEIRTALDPGAVVAGKYQVREVLGQGWEGDVYLVKELGTGIERSMKIYDPRRNPRNRTLRWNARKLHRLRGCGVLVQYRTQEKVQIGGRQLTMLVADFEQGECLMNFLKRQPGKRLDFFQGLHLMHSLASGLEEVHDLGEYHGDIHDENIIVRRTGTGFEIRLLDLLDLGPSEPALIRRDIHQAIRLFYDILGGQRAYRRHPPEVKSIICGLKTSLIDRKFRSGGQLRRYIDHLAWDSR